MRAFLLSLVVLVCAAQADWVIQEQLTEACGDGSWEVSNVMLYIGVNDTQITVDTIRSSQNLSRPVVHEVKMNLPRCENKAEKCPNNTVTVTDVDCISGDLSEVAEEVCEVALALTAWEARERYFQGALGRKPRFTVCITRGSEKADGDLDNV